MTSCKEKEIELITECFFNFQKFQIQMCAYRHPIFQDYIIESTAERHFKHFWNVIVKIVQGHDSFGENLSTLLDFSVFTPKYTKAYIDHIILPERIELICKTCISSKDFSEILFNIFVQILVSQKPRKSLEMVKSVLAEYEKSSTDSSSLRQLYDFYALLQDVETDAQARQLIDAVNYYLSFRERSQYTSKLSGFQFSRILLMIFEKLESFPYSLANVLKYDPLIFSFLECEMCSNISISQIPPFSFIVQSKIEVPKSFFMRYREIFISTISMFLIFSKLRFTEEERKYLAMITGNVLSYVESSSVGRDAFIFILLHFLRSDFLRKNAEFFFQYVSEGEIISGDDNNNNSGSYKDICRYNAMAIFVFAFDQDIFPSTISLICNEHCHSLITRTLKRIIDHFPKSPFRDKTRSVFDKINGHPHLKKSLFERATQITFQIWKNGFQDSNKGEAVNLLIDLSQRRTKTLISEGSAININSSNIKYFLQLALAFFTKNTMSQKQFPFYCYIASVLFPFASTDSQQRYKSQFLNNKNENNNNIMNTNNENENSILSLLPQWHFYSIYRESIILKMIDGVNLLSFLTRLSEGLPPSLFLGGFLLFSKLIQYSGSDIRTYFSQFSAVNYSFLSILMQKAALYELPEVTREMMRLMEKCPELSIDCIQLLTNTLISIAETHGFRTFIRFLAPLLRNEQYTKQIIIRNYYTAIVEALLQLAKSDVIVTSISFINFWRVLGTFPSAPNIESTLEELVCITFEKIEQSENENYFYNSLYELAITHKISFIFNLLKNCTKYSDKMTKLLLKLPKKAINEVDAETMEVLNKKFSSDIANIMSALKSDENKNEASVKWTPWPINDFIYEVTGMVCSVNFES